MRWRNLLLIVVFVNLTRPDGGDVYINPEAVAAVLDAHFCDKDAHTDIVLLSGAHICVSEDPPTVFHILKDAKQ